MKQLISRLALACVCAITLVSCASAPIENERHDVSTVIVTGHEVRAKLLADMLQHYTRQPVIIVSSLQAKKFYSVPAPPRGESREQVEARKKNPQAGALEIPVSEFHNYINFLHPKQVVFLGNTNYVPLYYINSVNKGRKVYTLKDTDWLFNAAQCEELFGIEGLAEEYHEHLKKLALGGTIDQKNLSRPGDNEPGLIKL